MITKISRYVFIVLFILAAAVYLPGIYWKVAGKSANSASLYFSPVINEFVGTRSSRTGDSEYFDVQGKTYTLMEYEKLLPFLFYYDLDKWNVLPKEIQGVPIDISYIRRNVQYLMFAPSELHTPMIRLFPLFESKSDFTRLTLPEEVFRINERMEFINTRSNAINEPLTTAFTEALQAAGFVFPAGIIAGNPTTRKQFDEGYFIVDAAGYVFHVKMVKGQPFCQRTAINPDLGVRHIVISENSRREFYGYLIDKSNNVYLIMYDNYSLTRLPLEHFNPDEMKMRFIADPIFRTISYYNREKVYGVVTDLNYNLTDSCHIDLIPFEKTPAGKIGKSLFPFKIETESNLSDYKCFRLVLNGNLGLISLFTSLLIFFLIRAIKGKEKLRDNPLDLLIVALTGIYGLLAVLIIRPEVWDKSADPFGY